MQNKPRNGCCSREPARPQSALNIGAGRKDNKACSFCYSILVQEERKLSERMWFRCAWLLLEEKETQWLCKPIEQLHQSQCTCPGNEYWPLDSSFCAVQLFRCLSKWMFNCLFVCLEPTISGCILWPRCSWLVHDFSAWNHFGFI